MATHGQDDGGKSPIALRELEPSPVEETPLGTTTDSYFPDAKQRQPRRSTSTLGLSDHSLMWWLNRIHRYSTYPFTAYLAAHITNTSLLPLALQSVPAADTYLLLTRPYYQSFPFEEALVLAPIALHLGSGLGIRLLRRKRSLEQQGAESRADRQRVAWPPVSGTGALGLALAPLAAGHFALSRALPWIVHGGSSGVGLAYVAHAFARSPALTWTAFSALLGVGVAHFVWGWAKWWGVTPEFAALATAGTQEHKRRAARRRRWTINGITALTTAVWAAGALGVVAREGKAVGWEGKNYDRLLDSVPVIGHWL